MPPFSNTIQNGSWPGPTMSWTANVLLTEHKLIKTTAWKHTWKMRWLRRFLFGPLSNNPSLPVLAHAQREHFKLSFTGSFFVTEAFEMLSAGGGWRQIKHVCPQRHLSQSLQPRLRHGGHVSSEGGWSNLERRALCLPVSVTPARCFPVYSCERCVCVCVCVCVTQHSLAGVKMTNMTFPLWDCIRYHFVFSLPDV